MIKMGTKKENIKGLSIKHNHVQKQIKMDRKAKRKIERERWKESK